MAQDTFAASRTPPSAEQTTPGRGRRIATAIAWISVVLALLAGLAELMGGVGYRLHWWGVGAGIRTVGIGALAAVAAFVIAISALLVAWLSGVRRAVVIAAVGLVVGVLLAAPP